MKLFRRLVCSSVCVIVGFAVATFLIRPSWLGFSTDVDLMLSHRWAASARSISVWPN